MILTIKKKLKILKLQQIKGQVDKNQVFKIYKQIPFDLNTLINAQNVYQSLEKIEGRALNIPKIFII